ncbi:hypothetical protein SAMN05421823_10952 [Catalinimonas alkaloidigena]|uniref:CBU-0592-like domain-containing protein n=1 Tax=Catalinimonas alkaloidigena TaxID=1075417 RepID=A0A1G9P1T2_9BACT|nr:hypothetical protein [Catalinimonas alkaloidigena]SDL92644.1 hypothetical protein SAMN05421823_10952 [Catalinimonas alkaloidigena]
MTGQAIMTLFGWLGTLLYLLAYFLLVTKRWTSTSLAYHLCNILGGVLLTLNTLYDKSLPAAFLNGAWALIAGYGLIADRNANRAP